MVESFPKSTHTYLGIRISLSGLIVGIIDGSFDIWALVKFMGGVVNVVSCRVMSCCERFRYKKVFGVYFGVYAVIGIAALDLPDRVLMQRRF